MALSYREKSILNRSQPCDMRFTLEYYIYAVHIIREVGEENFGGKSSRK